MATLSAIRDGLKAQLATISGLRAFDTVPGQVSPPAAIVSPQTITFDSTMARGSDEYTFVVQLLVGLGADAQSQDALDAYLAPSGASSVKAAIEADPTLGDAADSVRVVSASGYGQYEYGEGTYLGVEFVVEVIASGA